MPGTAEIAPNVMRGAEFLDDAYGPEWDKEINLRYLDLGDTCQCVVGQLTRHEPGLKKHERYWHGLEVLDITSPSRLGFVTAGRQTFARLTESWTRLIAARREARRRS